MYLAQIRFGALPVGVPRKAMESTADRYLGRLLRDGQIGTFYFLAWTGKRLVAHVVVPRPDALLERHHSESGLEALTEIRNQLGRPPQFVLTDDDVPKRFPRPQSAPFLVLYSNACAHWDDQPIKRGTDGCEFPAYLFAMDQTSHPNLGYWVDGYSCHFEVWLQSGRLELPAWRELVDPASETSEMGRELCRKIEKASGIPTYYYLDRYWAMPEGERDRRCPACGGRWRLAKPHVDDTQKSYWEIAYLCKKCRLVSRSACSEGSKRQATIGFRAARASRRVESSVGNGVSCGFTSSGISVQPITTASHPRSLSLANTSLK